MQGSLVASRRAGWSAWQAKLLQSGCQQPSTCLRAPLLLQSNPPLCCRLAAACTCLPFAGRRQRVRHVGGRVTPGPEPGGCRVTAGGCRGTAPTGNIVACHRVASPITRASMPASPKKLAHGDVHPSYPDCRPFAPLAAVIGIGPNIKLVPCHMPPLPSCPLHPPVLPRARQPADHPDRRCYQRWQQRWARHQG